MSEPGARPALGTSAVQAAFDVIVVGAGLAGLFAGALAARRGARTLVIARGLGGTHLGPGTVDVWGHSRPGQLAADPMAALGKRRARGHPLALAGMPALHGALEALVEMCAEEGYPLAGHIRHNYHLPTALGAIRPTCLVPESMVAGDVREPGELTIARLPDFRDFQADLAAANLCAAGYAARALPLELPGAPARRDAYATDLARLMDDANYRAMISNRWREALHGVTRLGLPAILGLEHAPAARRDLSDRLRTEVFEIPILPPSVPGMRLFNAVSAALRHAGGRLLIGPEVRRWVEPASGGSEAGRAAGVVAHTPGGARKYAARWIILATGGFRHGGLESPARGQVREAVFDLPVPRRKKWFAPFYWDDHPYARLGVRVNEELRPVDARGRVLFANLFAVGGLLAGADRTSEGSREGIDLATGWKAVQQLPLRASENPDGQALDKRATSLEVDPDE